MKTSVSKLLPDLDLPRDLRVTLSPYNSCYGFCSKLLSFFSNFQIEITAVCKNNLVCCLKNKKQNWLPPKKFFFFFLTLRIFIKKHQNKYLPSITDLFKKFQNDTFPAPFNSSSNQPSFFLGWGEWSLKRLLLIVSIYFLLKGERKMCLN